MFTFLALAFLVALFLWFMPIILIAVVAIVAVLFCLLMAAYCWVRDLFTPSKKKPTR